MILRFFLIASSLASLISADRDESENRLHWHLFKSYGSALVDTRPATSQFDTTDVYLSLVMYKFIEMQEKDEVFIAQYFLQLLWEDKRLTWNVSDFENISSIYVKTDMIWVPDVVLINDAKRQDDDIVPQSAYAFVNYDGNVAWAPSFRWSVSHCSMDSTWFPFDEQYCDLVYESWRYPVQKVNLTAQFNDVDGTYDGPGVYSDFQPNDQWELIDITVLLALSFYQILVSDNLPASSRSVPVVVMYFLFVMILCVMSLGTTICVMYLENRCSDKVPVPVMPHWMKWLICLKLASCLRMRPSLKPASPSPVDSRKNSIDFGDFQNNGQQPYDVTLGTTDKLLVEIRNLLRAQVRKEAEDRETAEENEEKKNEWKLAAAVIDRILFITFSTLFVGGTLLFSITFAVAFMHIISM